jgi:hypothetical protein
MDSEPYTQKNTKNEGQTKKQICRNKSSIRKLFSTIWIRRSLCVNNEMDGIILDNRSYFLFYLGCFFWIIFLLFGN